MPMFFIIDQKNYLEKLSKQKNGYDSEMFLLRFKEVCVKYIANN